MVPGLNEMKALRKISVLQEGEVGRTLTSYQYGDAKFLIPANCDYYCCC